MTLHWAEAIAGELIAWTLAGHALVRAWRRHRQQNAEPGARDDPADRSPGTGLETK